MSIHKSLKLKNTLARQRSVLSRWERIVKLTEDGRFEAGRSVMGLPKVRTKFRVRVRKVVAPGEGEAKPGEGEAPKA